MGERCPCTERGRRVKAQSASQYAETKAEQLRQLAERITERGNAAFVAKNNADAQWYFNNANGARMAATSVAGDYSYLREAEERQRANTVTQFTNVLYNSEYGTAFGDLDAADIADKCQELAVILVDVCFGKGEDE